MARAKIGAYRPSVPFYVYSSFNKREGRTHPRVVRLRNRVLDMWAEMADYETIAHEVGVSITTIKSYIRRSRRMGDPRAQRPFKDKKIARAAIRRKRMRDMASKGMTAREIAKRLDCSVRLVEIRLKEKASA